MGHALNGGSDAGSVHEGEHGLQALVGFTNQGADGAIKVQHGGGIRVDAHFVLQRAGVHAIARTHSAVSRDHPLGYHKQRDATGASGRTGQAGQHDMDDVFSQIVVTGRNENLAAVRPGF